MKKDTLKNDKSIEKISSNKIKIISSSEITCNVDGEELTDKEFTIELQSKKMKIYYDEEMITRITKKR